MGTRRTSTGGGDMEVSEEEEGTIISEIPPEGCEVSSINGVLWYCKRRILRPYLRVLGVLGLKPLCTEEETPSSASSKALRHFNKAYVLLLLLLVLTGHSLHILTCFRRDKGLDYVSELAEAMELEDDTGAFHEIFNSTSDDSSFEESSSSSSSVTPTTSTTTETTFVINVGGNRKRKKGTHRWNITIIPSKNNPSGDELPTVRPPDYPIPQSIRSSNICRGNLFYVQFLPIVFHVVPFLYMIYLYWLNHDEQLQNLMERVFIQATQAYSTLASQKKILRTLKFLVFFGCVWILVSMTVLILQISARRVVVMYFPWMGFVERKVVCAIMGIATVLQDAIQATVIISYCIQCNLLSTYLDFLYSRVSQHSISLQECIKEIGEFDKLLQYVNNELASGVLPLVLLDTVYCLGSVSVIIKGTKPWYDLAISAVLSLLWLFLLCLPVLQAGKLSLTLKKVRELGHLVRMRPFGYQNYNQADLDSFLLFVSTVKMDVRMLLIPLSATKISAFVCSAIFVLFVWGYFS